jgi:HTH-type transcriptional regulator, cell division transcriptional repressor
MATRSKARRQSRRGHNILGPRIRAARERMVPTVTQADLAARLTVKGIDVDRPTITRIENGERFLRDYEIKLIAKILGVTTAWLFDEAD